MARYCPKTARKRTRKDAGYRRPRIGPLAPDPLKGSFLPTWMVHRIPNVLLKSPSRRPYRAWNRPLRWSKTSAGRWTSFWEPNPGTLKQV